MQFMAPPQNIPSLGKHTDARALTRPDIIDERAIGADRYPKYLTRARGCRVWDIDGKEYVDYLMGYGPVVLGHGDGRVTKRVISELSNGNCTSPFWNPLQYALTGKLVDIVPGAEMALLLKTGSDATSAAVRLARIATNRTMVLRSGYNGWHDWSVEQAAGIPEEARKLSIGFRYGDIEGLRRLATQHATKLAAVITVPFENETVSADYLTEVKRIAHAAGALFILDEVRSGFRVALGGAQHMLGVQADMACFSKALANGYPISAITGPRHIMLGLQQTKISSTYFAGPVEMAAALATIDALENSDALETIWAAGQRLQAGLRTVLSELHVKGEVQGYPPMPYVRFSKGAAGLTDLQRSQFYAELASRGVLMHPSHQWFVSAAHDDASIDSTINSFGDALCAIRGQTFADDAQPCQGNRGF